MIGRTIALISLLGLLTGCAAYRYQHAPREISEEFMSGLSTAEMVTLGQEIVHGRGLCFNCHRIGDEGKAKMGPDLQGVGLRAQTRIDGVTDVEYLAQSLYDPDAFVVPNYNPSMIAADESPISLTDEEILMAIAYLQSLGGEATVTAGTVLSSGAE